MCELSLGVWRLRQSVSSVSLPLLTRLVQDSIDYTAHCVNISYLLSPNWAASRDRLWDDIRVVEFRRSELFEARILLPGCSSGLR